MQTGWTYTVTNPLDIIVMNVFFGEISLGAVAIPLLMDKFGFQKIFGTAEQYVSTVVASLLVMVLSETSLEFKNWVVKIKEPELLNAMTAASKLFFKKSAGSVECNPNAITKTLCIVGTTLALKWALTEVDVTEITIVEPTVDSIETTSGYFGLGYFGL